MAERRAERVAPRPAEDLVALADRIYAGVVVDPGSYRPEAARLLERARREGPAEALVVALRAHAWAERLAVRNASARRLLDEAVRVAERHRLDRRLAEVLVSRVAVQTELGHLAAAQRDADRAATLLPPAGRAELLFQQAVVHQNAQRLELAAGRYRRLLAGPDCPVVIRAKAGNNLAHLEGQLGHSAAARSLLDSAAADAVAAGPTVQAYVALTRAWVEVQAGRLTRSLSYFDEAHQRYEAAGLPLGEHHLEYSDALAGLRLLPEALAAARRALAELPEGEVSLMAAEAQLRVARLSLLAGDTPAALAAAESSAALLSRQRRPGLLARAAVLIGETKALASALTGRELGRLRQCARVLERCGMRSDAVEAHLLAGRYALRAGQPGAPGGQLPATTPDPQAAASLRSAVRLSHGAPVLLRTRGRVAAALLAAEADDRKAVLTGCRRGLADLDRHRLALPSYELRVLASAHGAELGVLGLRALTRPGQLGSRPTTPARVFDWLERTRAAALAPVETLTGPRVEHGLVTLRALQGELAALRDAGAAEPAALLRQVVEAEAELRRASWSPESSVQNAPDGRSFRAAQVREQVGAAVLVEFAALDGQLLAVVLDRRRTRLVELGATHGLDEELDALQFALRRLARPGSAAAAEGARSIADCSLSALRGRVLLPLGIDPAAPLVVVPVDALQRAPWAALHPGPTTVAPSAQVWLRTRQAAAPSGRVALVAGPRLPGAVPEVRALQALHPTAVMLVPPESSGAATIEALRGAGLAHLACHGRVRADNPVFSSLLLADGPLSVQELTVAAGAPFRVVLAACESGAQTRYAGDEALGFVTALLARGCAGIVASGVPVPDAEVLPLMCALHERLVAGDTLAEALWSARSGLDPAEPAQFAALCAFDAYGAA